MTTPYDRLKALGLTLPTPAVPVANYVPYVLANGFLYLSGLPVHHAVDGIGECRVFVAAKRVADGIHVVAPFIQYLVFTGLRFVHAYC